MNGGPSQSDRVLIATMTNCPALGQHLDNMRAIQSTAYPAHWTQQERDEATEQQLFGSN